MAWLFTGVRRQLLTTLVCIATEMSPHCLPSSDCTVFTLSPEIETSQGINISRSSISVQLWPSVSLSTSGSLSAHSEAVSHCLPSLGTLKPCPKSTSWDRALTAPVGRGLGAGSSLRLPAGAGPLHMAYAACQSSCPYRGKISATLACMSDARWSWT